MVRWIPDPERENPQLLAALGLTGTDELFRDIPAAARVGPLGLPGPLEEPEVISAVDRLLEKNQPRKGLDSFLGSGLYDRPSPAVVDGILQRSEFYTSYTQYQAEASQGMLQALFEFQSLWVELTGMEVANSSLYDGDTALGEALLMARRLREGRYFLVPQSLRWERKSILSNYARGPGARLKEIPQDSRTGRLDLGFLEREARNDCFGVLVEYPDSWGLLQEDLPRLRGILGDVPWVVSADPLALTVLDPPGKWGADLVVGEGQGFGIPPSYGGPLLGLMAARRRDLRHLPGRLVGATTDPTGRRAFTLTLQTREQHIRRSKATSNICTNQALMTLAFLGYASAMGPRTLARMAEAMTARAHELARRLGTLPGLVAPRFSAPFLYEVPVEVSALAVKDFLSGLLSRGILGGVPLYDPRPGSSPPFFPGYMAAVGPATSGRSLDRYAAAAQEVLQDREGG